MKAMRVLGVLLVLLVPACVSPYLLPSLYLEIAGVTTRGEVTGTHRVSASFYDRLETGGAAGVVYSPWPVLRSLNMVGMGSALADSSWWSRIPGDGDSVRSTADIAGISLTVLLAWVAWRRKTNGWILAAACCATVVCSSVLLFGFVAFRLLFAVWRKHPGRGFGTVLAASMLLAAGVLYWRIPRPAPVPGGRTAEAAATVLQVHTADHIWSD